MRNITLFILFVTIIFALFRPPAVSAQTVQGYDIIIVAGQSNNLAGIGRDPAIDVGAPNIYQLGRYEPHVNQIIPATEPLEFHTVRSNLIGYALTFARLLKTIGYGTPSRPLLILPAAKGGTGFSNNDWNPGDPLYADLVEKANVLMNLPDLNNRIIAFTWLQGEQDAGRSMSQDDYETRWLAMINGLQNEITGFTARTPVLIGQMVPSWFKSLPANKGVNINRAHRHLPSRRPHTIFVSAEAPTELGNNDEAYLGIADIPVHYSAASQRKMAQRFFTAFKQLAPPNSPSPTPSPTPTPISNPADLTDTGDIPGDQVNQQDADQLKADFGKTGSPGWISSDINDDGKVDIFDYNILVEHFGE